MRCWRARRDQAAQAAREADRVRRAGAHLPRARAARRTTCPCAVDRVLASHDPNADALLGFLRDGIQHADPAHRREARCRGAGAARASVGSSVAKAGKADGGAAHRRRRAPAAAGDHAAPGRRRGRARGGERGARSTRRYKTVTTAERLGRGSTTRARPVASPSIPRRRASMRCRPTSSASRWRSRRARPATCRSRMARAAATCSAAAGLPADPLEAPRAAEAAARGPSVLKIGQNLKYDALVMARTASRSRRSTTRC